MAYCKNTVDQNWYEFDDSMVTRVSSAEIRRQEAYVLFYERKDFQFHTEEESDDLDEEEAMQTADEDEPTSTSTGIHDDDSERVSKSVEILEEENSELSSDENFVEVEKVTELSNY